LKKDLEKKNDIFDFENLKVYQKSLDFIDFAYELTQKFPSDELYNLTSQFRRAAVSISLNIGEGSGGSRKEFIQFLIVSRRSIRECVICTTISIRRKYIDEKTQMQLREELTLISKMTSGLINYLESDNAKNMMSEPSDIYLRTPNSEPRTPNFNSQLQWPK
jgi:four helix bundle protein